jgi:hypothetical protein
VGRSRPTTVDRPDADDLLADPPPSWIVEHAIDQLGQRCDARDLAGRLVPGPRGEAAVGAAPLRLRGSVSLGGRDNPILSQNKIDS